MQREALTPAKSSSKRFAVISPKPQSPGGSHTHTSHCKLRVQPVHNAFVWLQMFSFFQGKKKEQLSTFRFSVCCLFKKKKNLPLPPLYDRACGSSLLLP